jgi:hypothetical protein
LRGLRSRSRPHLSEALKPGRYEVSRREGLKKWREELKRRRG